MVKRTDDTDRETKLEQRAKALFDDSVADLDRRTRSALTEARHAALAELEGRRRLRWQVWGPLSGVTAAAFVLLVIFAPLKWTQEAVEGAAATPLEDLDIVADAESLEMLENLEFYAWLDSTQVLPSDG
jgi:hypothetical protein